jgi:hypothetical protein
MIKPIDLLSLADRLLASGIEVDGRAAVSRAYYGAYHAAQELIAEECGVVLPRGADAHQTIHRCLMNCQDVVLRDAGSRLESLREERNRADYDLDDARFAKAANVHVQVEKAKVVAAQIASAQANVTRIQDALRAYASGVLKLRLKTV